MNHIKTRLLVSLGAVITFLCGAYGIVYRAPTQISNELQGYFASQIVTLLPFVALIMLANKNYPGNSMIASNGVIMGLIGGFIYLSEMVFSREPSWGFTFLIVPLIQAVYLLFLWLLLPKKKKII